MRGLEYSVGQKIGNCIYLGGDYWDGRRRRATFGCVCGNEFVAVVDKVKRFHTTSCGCLHKKILIDRNTKHGFAKRGKKSKEYNIWVLIKQRCYNEKYPDYSEWGGRGIRMCDEWIDSFETFIMDMGNCPEGCRGIDRMNNEGHYAKSNCRWATYTEQARNTRRNRNIVYRGIEKTLTEWVIEMKLSRSMFYYWSKKGMLDSDILEKLKTNNNAE